QIQQLPKSNTQDAYYLRQFNFYSLCITILDRVNPTFYTWTEELSGEGSTEISSALYSHLRKMNLEVVKRHVLQTPPLSHPITLQKKDVEKLLNLMHGEE
ncbi:hypothetical protein J6590_106361, partial [Homalodisca vitripennis]